MREYGSSALEDEQVAYEETSYPSGMVLRIRKNLTGGGKFTFKVEEQRGFEEWGPLFLDGIPLSEVHHGDGIWCPVFYATSSARAIAAELGIPLEVE